MLFINRQYEGFYGGVDSCGDGATKTLFYHFLGFPLIPRRSYFVVSDGFFSREHKVIELARRNARSIATAYVTWWPVMTGVCLAAFAVFQARIGDELIPVPGDPMLLGLPILFWGTAVAALVAASCGLIAGALVTSRLDPDEVARRKVFARYVGSPVNPAELRDPGFQGVTLKHAMAEIA